MFHELGHALPGLLFSNKTVTIFIGSYGIKEGHWHFSINRLEVFWRRNILKSRGGLCVLEDNNLSFGQSFIFVLGGPILSLLVSSLLVYTAFYLGANAYVSILLWALFFSTAYSSIISLIPKKKSIILSDNQETYNDGELLRRLFVTRKIPIKVKQLYPLYYQKKYEELEEAIDKLYKESPSPYLCQLAIGNLIALKKYDKALEYDTRQREIGKYTSDHHVNYGLILLYQDKYDEAEIQFKMAIQMQKKNATAWNNYGYLLILQEQWEPAIEVLEKELRHDSEHAYIHNNLATAYLALDNDEQALTHIGRSLLIKKDNAYVYITKGQYLTKKEQYEEAIECFEKARELDPEARNLEKHANEAHQKLSLRSIDSNDQMKN